MSGAVAYYNEIDPFVLRTLVKYDPVTGGFIWLPRTPDHFTANSRHSASHRCNQWNSNNAGNPAFIGVDTNGSLVSSIFGKACRAHRVAWAIVHGAWPVGVIDHIDGNRTNNAINNLRDVTARENNRNLAMRAANTSGVMGVVKRGARWVAFIGFDNKRIHLGTFDTIDAAAAARAKAQKNLGFHPNHGRRAGSNRSAPLLSPRALNGAELECQ